MTDVFDRVDAMHSISALWPAAPSLGSPFAKDNASNPPVTPYLATRIQLLEAIRLLQRAADLAQEPDGLDLGAHLIVLRPALALAAKAAWISDPNQSETRIDRAVALAIADQLAGARAMDRAVEQGANPKFAAIGDHYRAQASRLAATTAQNTTVPGDGALIQSLGARVERYDGDPSAASDMQLLWNGSSSLAHGERWLRLLTGQRGSTEIADTLNQRSLDIVCSGINVSSLRLVELCSTPALWQ